MGLTRDQRVLVHQVHPAKLAVDIGTSVVSNALLWRRSLVAGLFVRYASPVVGSVLVLRFADLERLSRSRAGQYVLQHMPPAMVALRLAGDTLMAVGAWKAPTGVVRGWIGAGRTGLVGRHPSRCTNRLTSPLSIVPHNRWKHTGPEARYRSCQSADSPGLAWS